MTALTKIFVGILLMVATGTLSLLQAQDDELSEDSKLNTNVGMSWTVPLNPTAKFINFGWGVLVMGAGYNFNKHHSLVGEFMWNSLYPTNGAIAPFKIALHSPHVSGHGNLFSLTANYRYELRGKAVGTYFIGGGGLYIRNAHISKQIPIGNEVTCTQVYLWWGFTCSSGTVTVDQTLASSSSGVFGVNGGIGFTAKVGEPRYRMYIETRYHYAPNHIINTQVIPITVGIRF